MAGDAPDDEHLEHLEHAPDEADDDDDEYDDDESDEYDDDEYAEYDDETDQADDEAGESPFRDRPPIATDRARRLLADGEVSVVGRMPWSSNATFLVDVTHEGLVAQGIYKPLRGERPLWDFPGGLYTREVATFELSEWLGWELVPPTVERDGPFGIGSLQLYVPNDHEQHYFTLRDEPGHRHTLERLCIFDLISNNTDRKSGHCLLGTDGRIWAIDNGLSFHAEFKLRTVLWDFAGEAVPADIVADVESLLDRGLPPAVADRLDAFERDAVLARARAVVAERRFPIDHSGRRWPWPLV
jgi:uncharacterized repeat protein (TIGR03843 family)